MSRGLIPHTQKKNSVHYPALKKENASWSTHVQRLNTVILSGRTPLSSLTPIFPFWTLHIPLPGRNELSHFVVHWRNSPSIRAQTKGQTSCESNVPMKKIKKTTNMKTFQRCYHN
uniref:Uncharacterized protein n=1 Tax=Trypanosoma congolense (strain IL3000) TaxID=1068625 RepID=G0UPF1_TRYCI|nr:hypothetical protein, unlikely [Trypanosoma congolense IL3000]